MLEISVVGPATRNMHCGGVGGGGGGEAVNSQLQWHPLWRYWDCGVGRWEIRICRLRE